MKRIFFGALLLVSCSLLTAHAVQAQCGGKAEPSRITFKRGSHSVTLKGKLRGDEQAEYTFGGRKGQHLTINVAAIPSVFISLELQDPNGAAFRLLGSGNRWSGDLPETGDYLLYVKILDAKTRRASYTLTLSIR